MFTPALWMNEKVGMLVITPSKMIFILSSLFNNLFCLLWFYYSILFLCFENLDILYVFDSYSWIYLSFKIFNIFLSIFNLVFCSISSIAHTSCFLLLEFNLLVFYWLAQKLPQICTVIAYICIGKVAWFVVYICGTIWNVLYI